MRKAQGLSLTTIVVAAIALLVLVILSVIFIGNMSGWLGKTKACPSSDLCVDASECTSPSNNHHCEVNGEITDQVCCLINSEEG